jgi:hypothetical protein
MLLSLRTGQLISCQFLSAHMPRKQKQLEAVLMNGIIRYRFDWSTALKPFRQLDSSI